MDGGSRLEFESGAFVYLSSTSIQDPAKSWQRLAATRPDLYSVSTVKGFPAWLSDAAKDETGEAEGGVVAVMENNTYVAVIGNGRIPLDDLVATAESLQVFMEEPLPSPSVTLSR